MELTTDALKQLQTTELGILRDFDAFCRQRGLRYFLIGGALLGARRYGKFIPWDDDIDVAMPREDYERLKREYSADGYFLQNAQSDPVFARCIQKIRKNGTRIAEYATMHQPIHQGIYIDIFPIDYVDDNDQKRLDKRSRKIRRLMSLCAIKSGCNIGSFAFVKRLIKLFYPCSKQRAEEKLYRLCTMENDGARAYAILWLHNYPWYRQIHEKGVFGKGSLCAFEGEQYAAPAKVDAFLEKVFGEDYLQDPPKEKQKTPHKYMAVEFSSEN